jgi:hypothetical protein
MAVGGLGNQGRQFNSTIEEAEKLSSELTTIAAGAGEWLTADATSKLLRPALKFSMFTTLCKRLHAGLIRARCAKFMIAGKTWRRDALIPRGFWWAEGEAALTSNWVTGDFETWLDHQVHLQAFGVSCYRADIEDMMPAPEVAPQRTEPAHEGGRPTAKFWDDLWVEMCRQIYTGELIPERQADIQKAMQQWCSDNGHSDATSTIKPRASKLWYQVFADREK